jgi:thioesterase domain-containing protein
MRRGAPIAPLYCIHPGGGSIIRYRPLVDALSGARPVYGVQSRGLLDPTFVDRSIDEMATHYVDTIRQRQPEGPYFLIGWCLGGVIAMAMAALLEAQGEEIAFLGLVDSSTAVVSFPGEASILDYLEQLAAIEGVKLGAALTPDERTLLAQASEQRSARERLTYAAEWGREKGYWSDVSTELFERLFSDSENSLRMLQDLRLKRISSSIHVWWAEATLRALGGPPVDWAELTQGDAAIRLVPATHEDILTQAELHSEVDRAVDIAERALRLERSSTAENAYS